MMTEEIRECGICKEPMVSFRVQAVLPLLPVAWICPLCDRAPRRVAR